MNLATIQETADRLRGEIRKVVVGLDPTIDLFLTSLLSSGHILLEGVPGTAKTLLTQTFAAGLTLDFGRIQFTPDLMPGDVLGTNLMFGRTGMAMSRSGKRRTVCIRPSGPCQRIHSVEIRIVPRRRGRMGRSTSQPAPGTRSTRTAGAGAAGPLAS